MWYEVYVNGESRFRAHERDLSVLLDAIKKECVPEDEIVLVRREVGNHSAPHRFLKAI